ncbi:hypothetical protein BpHYR1_025430 [Brachionus plicatilis]|uniref:Uncharacterized protein n=1 Tax=Brachionus plicatilis TaxID=10195 RepID=A0A3M7RBS9_BRAPC|nr:hypothetical protein BpHYR1_025430 [Brachionus plicatilis]
MSISSILMISQNSKLKHPSLDRLIFSILWVFKGNNYPASWFGQIVRSDFSQIIYMCTCFNYNSTWCIAFVRFVIGIDTNIFDFSFLLKLHIDQMRLWTVGLPERVHF